MKLIKDAAAEIWSLFVDDPAFVGLIVIWTLAVHFARTFISAHAAGPILFAGFAVLLLVFTCRRAARQ